MKNLSFNGSILIHDPAITSQPIKDPDSVKHPRQLSDLFYDVAKDILLISNRYLCDLVIAEQHATNLANVCIYASASIKAEEFHLADEYIDQAEVQFHHIAKLLEVKATDGEPPVRLKLSPRQKANFEMPLRKTQLTTVYEIISRDGYVSREELDHVIRKLEEHSMTHMLSVIQNSVIISEEERIATCKYNFSFRLNGIQNVFVSAKNAFNTFCLQNELLSIPSILLVSGNHPVPEPK